MNGLIRLLAFRTMVSPILLQLLFWAGVAGCLYGAYVLYSLGNWAWPFALFLGPLLVRVIFEQAILQFRIYYRLGEISGALNADRGD